MTESVKNKFDYIKKQWPIIRTWLVRLILKKIMPKIIGGPFGFLFVFASEKLFDKFLKPMWNKLTAMAYATSKKFKRKPKIKRLENANENDFDSSTDSMP